MRSTGQVHRQGQHVKLTGAITLETVTAIYRETRCWQQKNDLPESVDLNQIEGLDSSCVALLLEWASWAKSAGRQIQFANPPGALCALVHLFDIEQVLALENACNTSS